MSDWDISVYKPNRVAVTLFTGHEFTERDLAGFKADSRYWKEGEVDPIYRKGVDRLHEIARHSRRRT